MKMIKTSSFIKILIPLVLFLINIFIQNYNLGKLVNVFTDEGVYLYSAKLIANHFIPYKDFFLGQPFYALVIPTIMLIISAFNINVFHFLYTLWFFSLLFPLYFVIIKLTNNRLSAILALILFSTYQELVQWGAHQLDLRQVSLPFLAWSLFYIYKKPKPILASIFLALFSICIVTNFILSFLLIILILLGEVLVKRLSLLDAIKKHLNFVFYFTIITITCYITAFLIPHAIENIINYQLDRPFLPWDVRISWLIDNMTANWPIFLFGLGGSLIINQKIKLLGLFNLLGLLLVVFLGSNYYPHYLTILSIGLAITSATLISYLDKSGLKYGVILLIVLGIYQSSFNNLKYQLIEKTAPDFFQAINILKNLPEPLFTFEPIYGLYSHKNLAWHYNVADMRYFRVMGTNLNDQSYQEILDRSNTVLLEPFATSMLTREIKNYIQTTFNLVYQDENQKIYTKK